MNILRFCFQRWALARHVLYPSALPHIFGGLKVAVPYAVAMAVVGEMLGGESGLGFYIRGKVIDWP